jgi:hypothetical protein
LTYCPECLSSENIRSDIAIGLQAQKLQAPLRQKRQTRLSGFNKTTSDKFIFRRLRISSHKETNRHFERNGNEMGSRPHQIITRSITPLFLVAD